MSQPPDLISTVITTSTKSFQPPFNPSRSVHIQRQSRAQSQIDGPRASSPGRTRQWMEHTAAPSSFPWLEPPMPESPIRPMLNVKDKQVKSWRWVSPWIAQQKDTAMAHGGSGSTEVLRRAIRPPRPCPGVDQQWNTSGSHQAPLLSPFPLGHLSLSLFAAIDPSASAPLVVQRGKARAI
jgi:hypothetical protein